MKNSRAVLTAAVIVVVVLAGWWVFHRRGGERIDLIALFDKSTKQPDTAAFQVVDVTLAGDTKKAIAAPPNGRITFHVRVPDDGWLRLSLGMKPESWDKEGNGVYFYGGVSDGKSFESLFTQTVNPFKNASERHWIPVAVDLASYAGEDVDVILNTRESGPGQPPDARNDLPLWGPPVISR